MQRKWKPWKPTKLCSCGALIDRKADMCKQCWSIKHAENIPNKNELLAKLIEMHGNFTKTGKHYGVSDNAVRKWCRKYDLSTYSKDY